MQQPDAVLGCVAREGMVEVTFRGTGDVEFELFGVRIPIPKPVGDAEWQAVCTAAVGLGLAFRNVYGIVKKALLVVVALMGFPFIASHKCRVG